MERSNLEETGGIWNVRSKPGGRETVRQLLLGSKHETMVAWTSV